MRRFHCGDRLVAVQGAPLGRTRRSRTGMRIPITGRARRIAVAGTSVAALAMLAAACNYGPDGDQDVLAFAGSDTTQDVMGNIIAAYNADTAYNDDTNIPGDDRDILDNVLSVETNPHTRPA